MIPSLFIGYASVILTLLMLFGVIIGAFTAYLLIWRYDRAIFRC